MSEDIEERARRAEGGGAAGRNRILFGRGEDGLVLVAIDRSDGRMLATGYISGAEADIVGWLRDLDGGDRLDVDIERDLLAEPDPAASRAPAGAEARLRPGLFPSAAAALRGVLGALLWAGIGLLASIGAGVVLLRLLAWLSG